MKTVFIGLALFYSASGMSQNSFTVYFDFNKHTLTDDGRSQLDSFLRAEKQNLATFIFNLDGHCDSLGSDHYNNTLSLKRVSAVKKYLLRNGIETGSFANIRGHGKTEPLNGNKTDQERKLNRRVEITIVKVVETYLPGVLSLKEKLADSSATAGTNIVLRNINFVGGMHQFLPESTPMLEELSGAMKTYPKLIIRIEGHICCQQDDADGRDGETGIYNLSEARAKVVTDYLLANGIEPYRVSYKGFGHSSPVYSYPEKTEEERIANRRVEIKIVSK